MTMLTREEKIRYRKLKRRAVRRHEAGRILHKPELSELEILLYKEQGFGWFKVFIIKTVKRIKKYFSKHG